MAIILQTPSIEAIQSFDPAFDTTINYYYEDNQQYKNRIVITDNETSNVVYDKTEDSMRLYATIPANTLTAGKQYLAQVQVYDIDGNYSNLSDAALFYCFTTPTLSFARINNNDVYRNASIQLTLSYSQAQNEEIKNYQFVLYTEDKIAESSSDVIYSSTLSPYTFYGLKNNTKYYLRAYGETVHGMKMDTGYIGVNIQYDVIPANIAFQITNMYKSGYIQIETNILSVGYEIENDNYEFNDDGSVTLTDNSLTYNEGFEITDDFSLFIEAKKLPVTRFFTTNDEEISLSIINVCSTYYCKLTVKDSDISMCTSLPKARLSTDDGSYIITDDGKQIEIIDTSYDDNEFVVFELKRIKGLYSLNAYYKRERMV